MGGRGSSMSGRTHGRARASAGHPGRFGRKESSSVKTGLSRHESDIKGQPIEYAAGFKNNKNLFTTTTHNKAKVGFTSSEISSLRASNGRLTHNHPGGTGLSSQDIKLAVSNNLRQIRAVGVKDGKNQHYILQRKSGQSWKKVSKRKIDSTYDNAYNKSYKRYKNHNKAVLAANQATAKVVGGRLRFRSIKQTW